VPTDGATLPFIGSGDFGTSPFLVSTHGKSDSKFLPSTLYGSIHFIPANTKCKKICIAESMLRLSTAKKQDHRNFKETCSGFPPQLKKNARTMRRTLFGAFDALAIDNSGHSIR